MDTTTRVIYHCACFYEPFTPFTEKINGDLFRILKSKIYMTSLWKKATEIDKSCFESFLVNDESLQEAYVELYCDSAEYFGTTFRFGNEIYEFYFMHKNGIVLIFFRRGN